MVDAGCFLEQLGYPRLHDQKMYSEVNPTEWQRVDKSLEDARTGEAEPFLLKEFHLDAEKEPLDGQYCCCLSLQANILTSHQRN